MSLWSFEFDGQDENKQIHIVKQLRMSRMPILDVLKDSNQFKSNKNHIFLNKHDKNKMKM